MNKTVKRSLYGILGIAFILLGGFVYLGKKAIDVDKDIERDLRAACTDSTGAVPNPKLLVLLERVESGGIFEVRKPLDEGKLALWWKCMRVSHSSIEKCGKMTAVFSAMVSASPQSLISAEMEINQGIIKKCNASVGPGPSY